MFKARFTLPPTIKIFYTAKSYLNLSENAISVKYSFQHNFFRRVKVMMGKDNGFKAMKLKVKITNTTRNAQKPKAFGAQGKVIAANAELCTSLFSKAKGLMFSKKSEKALVFDFGKEKRIDLHMLFVFYPIDVIFLNNKLKVVELKENFMPFTFYLSRKKARYVIETNSGKIRETGTKLGNKIVFTSFK